MEIREDKFKNGRLKIRFHVKQDAQGKEVKHGLYTRWYANGNKKLEGRYVNGKKEGTFTEWRINGSKESETVFKKCHRAL
jgi:antitoxin component YwqK of YwqJK toxin-antitoxin module